MKRLNLLVSLSLLLAAIPAAGAQDTRAKTTLKVPSHDPVVAEAAQRGDAAAMKKAIAKGADVNLPQGDGMTALHWAAERGDAALTTALLAAHANVKAQTRIGGYTPLQIAAKAGNAAVVTALIKAGSDVKAVTETGATALHFAAAAGNPAVVDALLAAGANPNVKETEWGQTPLVFAAEFDRADAIKVLLKHGADPKMHTTELNLDLDAEKEAAATKKRNEVLISFEPEKHKNDTVKVASATPAATHARGTNAAAAPAGAVPTGVTTPGASPKPTAEPATGGHDSTAINALKAGAAKTAVNPDTGLTAANGGSGPPAFGVPGRGRPSGPVPKGPFTPDQIQTAIDSSRAVLARPLDGKGGPVKEVVDTLNGGVAGYAKSVGGVGGLSPLHHAARQGNIEAAMALLDGGADINDVSSVDHTTPLLMAAINGQFDLAMKLLARGADPKIASTVNMTPLYAVINTAYAPRSRYPQPEAVQSQRTNLYQMMQALLDKGADPNVRLNAQPWYFAFNNCGNANCGLEDLEGTTAFWRAAYAVDVDAMKLLVKYHADTNVPSYKDPKKAAAGRGGRGGRGAIAATPLPPDIDSASKAVPPGIGVFPIHAAAGVGYGNGYAGNSHRHAPDGWMPAMRYMVEVLHADVNARDENGYTPLHHAAARGDNDMIKYLVAHGADVHAVAKNGMTVVDMANGPVSRISPIPETIELLEKLGAKNTHRCVSC
jgi:ankyrin repeat protein